jgi:peptidoglycan L-alanyl-D-glutamate endopeptidase CwlK
MASRKVEDLTLEMQRLYGKFKEKMDAAGIPFSLTCTARSYQEQVALYAQGRQSLDEVNALRKLAGLSPILSSGNKKVTWTMLSKHLVKLNDSDLANDKSKAFDIVLLKDGKGHWDVKVSVNKNIKPDYIEAGEIGESVGLKWGGRFKSPDYPHFEQP